MSRLTGLKRFAPFLLLLVVVAVGQYFFLVSQRPVAIFLRSKLTVLTQPLKLSEGSNPNVPRPLHVLLLSYARSGSSFLGDILQTYPKSFYHFEPLHFMSEGVLNSSVSEAKQLLQRLFKCQVDHLPGFLAWQESHIKSFMNFKRSIRFWKACSKARSCYNSTYIDNYCAKHKVVIIKTIRFKLREAAGLLTDHPELNLKIVYLVRDPRGTLNSRMKGIIQRWCRKDPKCSETKHFCDLLEDDLEIACSLLSNRPNNFIIVRYEDLSRDPYRESMRLARFLSFDQTREIDAFLNTHTAGTAPPRKAEPVAYPYSTYRNSVMTASKWRHELPFVKSTRIQNECSEVLNHLGYYKYSTSAILRSNVNFDKSLEQSISKSCS